MWMRCRRARRRSSTCRFLDRCLTMSRLKTRRLCAWVTTHHPAKNPSILPCLRIQRRKSAKRDRDIVVSVLQGRIPATRNRRPMINPRTRRNRRRHIRYTSRNHPVAHRDSQKFINDTRWTAIVQRYSLDSSKTSVKIKERYLKMVLVGIGCSELAIHGLKGVEIGENLR
jgi:hypothetical protein